MQNKKTLAKNAIYNIVRTLMSVIFPLITFPYACRVLGVDGMGKYSFGNSIISYFLLLAGLGINTYAIREGAQYRDQKEKISTFASEVFTINVVSSGIAYLLLFLCLGIIPKLYEYKIVILIFSIEIFFSTLGVGWIINIYEEFRFVAIRSILFQLVSLIALFIIVRSPEDVYKYALITTFANGGANLVNYIYARKLCDFKICFTKTIRDHIKPILVIFSTTIAITVYVSSDLTMLGFMADDYVVGLYSASSKIYTIFKNVLVAALVVTIPRFSILAKYNAKEEINTFFHEACNYLIYFLVPAILGIILLSKDIVLLIGGSEYGGASTSLSILCIAAFFSLLAYLYTQCILIPYSEEYIVFKATFISAIVNIIINLIMIPILMEKAAAISTVIAEAIVFGISHLAAKKYITFKLEKNTIIATSTGTIAITLLCILGNTIFHASLFKLLFSVLTSVAVYIFISAIIKPKPYFTVSERVLKVLKRKRSKDE